MKEHDGKDDEIGERIQGSRVQQAPAYRLYSVEEQKLIRVTVKNLSQKELSFLPVYLAVDGTEEPEDVVTLKCGEVCARLARE